MSKFLIQTINGQVEHDFSWHLIQAIKYQNWFAGEEVHEYALSGKEHFDFKDEYYKEEEYIPIGSVEFICNYTQYHYGFSPKPINVPEELFDFAGREMFACHGTFSPKARELQKDKSKKYFVKSSTRFKANENGIQDFNFLAYSNKDNLQVSEIIGNIESEWRCFVYKDKLVGMHCYSGEWFNHEKPWLLKPRINEILLMIEKLKGKYPTYTLDVGIADLENTYQDQLLGTIDKGYETIPIEVHEFFSCGLYGFQDYKILPQMFVRAYKQIIFQGLDETRIATKF
jgi:hypothetical protein